MQDRVEARGHRARQGTNVNKGEGLEASGVELERVVGTCFVHFERQTEQRAFRSDTSQTRTFAHAHLSLWGGWQGTTTHYYEKLNLPI